MNIKNKIKKTNFFTIIVAMVIIGYLLFGTGNIAVIGKNLEKIKNNANSISKYETGDLNIYFFDVGQGDSILIKTEESSMLIDAGSNEYGMKVGEYLDKLGIEKLDYVIATHAHEDHIGGMDDIINNFEIGTFYMPDAMTTTKTFEDMLDALEENDLKYNVPVLDSTYDLDDATVQVLYTGTDTSDLNNTSIVLKVNYGENSFLFMGDAPISVENKLLDKDIKSDVLKVGHHGSEYSTSKEFLDDVDPEYAIISVGKNNKYNHPNDITLDRLSSKDIKVFRTDLNGSILITSDGTKIDVSMIDTNTN